MIEEIEKMKITLEQITIGKPTKSKNTSDKEKESSLFLDQECEV